MMYVHLYLQCVLIVESLFICLKVFSVCSGHVWLMWICGLCVQVSAELQQEVVMSLIQTDPGVSDYLLRRKHR